ncbi:hypothetical protein [Halococcus saccharolyticus]|nr:hypothetical protein [Halococcus saccharolyticus]
MAISVSGQEKGIDTGHAEQEPALTEARYRRATTEEMDAEPVAPAIYDVHSASGETYRIELESGYCGCADTTFRGLGCKHSQRAALAALFDDVQRNTRFVARVAAFAAEHGCEHDVRGCAGPTLVGKRGYPCTGCVAATGGDDWTVWTALVGDTGAGAGR